MQRGTPDHLRLRTNRLKIVANTNLQGGRKPEHLYASGLLKHHVGRWDKLGYQALHDARTSPINIGGTYLYGILRNIANGRIERRGGQPLMVAGQIGDKGKNGANRTTNYFLNLYC